MAIATQFIDETAEDEVVQSLCEKRDWMKNKRLELIDNLDELDKFVQGAIDVGKCAVDLETDGLNTGPCGRENGSRVAKIAGFVLSYDSSYGVYVPVNHTEGRNIPMTAALPRIKKIVSACVCIFHNFKFDGQLLRNEGIIIEDLKKYEDTLLACAVLMADRKNKGLKGLSKDILNQPMIELSEIVPNKSNINFCELHPKSAVHYAASDGVCTFALWEELERRLIDQDPHKNNGLRFIYDVEKGCQFAVMDMECGLVKIDVDHYGQAAKKISKRIEEIEDEIFESAGEAFDINSNKQLGVILFDKLGIPYPMQEKSKTGDYFVKEEVLSKIADKHSLPRLILELRSLEKVHGTYLVNLLSNYDDNHCVKFQLNQTAADSGRFSSRGGKGISEDGYSGVNVQNIPAATEKDIWKLRKGIVAREGYQIVAIDYSGEELRIAANLSKEPVWIKEFNEGSGDIHSITASLMFGGTPEEMADKKNKTKRGLAKIANFLIIYGGSAGTLARSARIPLHEAQQHVDNYFDGLKKLSEWIATERIRARRRGYSLTAFGRRRPLQDLFDSGDGYLKSKAERLAVNAAIQGTGADIIKIAMYKVWRYLKNHDLQDDVRMLFPVHDEIVYEIKKDKLDTYIPILSDLMKLDEYTKKKLRWPVGLEVDAEYGDDFSVPLNFFEDKEKGISASVRMGMAPGPEGTEENEKKVEHVEEEKGRAEQNSLEYLDPGVKGEDGATEELKTSSDKQKEELKGEFFNFEVQKTDSLAKAQADMIWQVLEGVDHYCKYGVKKRIRLTKSNKVVYTTSSYYSVEAFLALAFNYSI